MLSIIVSTYKPENFKALEDNISETAGIPFEIIKIENPGKMSLCEAYNTGAAKARFENLLFLHDDIAFKKENWGNLLIEHLKDSETGVIGIAGSRYVPTAPSGWFIEKDEKENACGKLTAIALDGVFMSCTKTKFSSVNFNESQIKGFHGYDYDFSLRMAKKYQNYIIKDIPVEHFSNGNPDQLFLDNHIKIRLNLGSDFKHPIKSDIEKKAFIRFLKMYFTYYPVNLRNLWFTLRFFPFKKAHLHHQFEMVKTYLHILKYRKNLHD